MVTYTPSSWESTVQTLRATIMNIIYELKLEQNSSAVLTLVLDLTDDLRYVRGIRVKKEYRLTELSALSKVH